VTSPLAGLPANIQRGFIEMTRYAVAGREP
jgi:hypothetical protein